MMTIHKAQCIALTLAFLVAIFQPCLATPLLDHCGSLVVEGCSQDRHAVLESIQGVSAFNCQRYCSNIYKDYCTFFNYNIKERLCFLIKGKQESYETVCKRIGSSVEPKIENCNLHMKHDCNDFVRSHCSFRGGLLHNLENIESHNHCQLACTYMDQCKFFMFDSAKKYCLLFSSDELNCDMIRGPPSPMLSTCNGSVVLEKLTMNMTQDIIDSTGLDFEDGFGEKAGQYMMSSVENIEDLPPPPIRDQRVQHPWQIRRQLNPFSFPERGFDGFSVHEDEVPYVIKDYTASQEDFFPDTVRYELNQL